MEVCVVCTGNTCRSPMAEALLGAALKARGARGVRVISAGTSAAAGMRAAEDALDAMLELGLDIQNHRSRPVLETGSALYLCMTRSHLAAVKSAMPHVRAALFLDYAGEMGDVPDPYGMGLSAYRMLAARLSRAADAAADKIIEELSKEG